MGWVHLLRLLSYSEVSDLDLQDHTQIVIEVQAMRTLCRNKHPVNLIEELSPHIQSDYVPGKKKNSKRKPSIPNKRRHGTQGKDSRPIDHTHSFTRKTTLKGS